MPTGLGQPSADPRASVEPNREIGWLEPMPDHVVWGRPAADPAHHDQRVGARDVGGPAGQRAQRDVGGAGDVPGLPLVVLADVEDGRVGTDLGRDDGGQLSGMHPVMVPHRAGLSRWWPATTSRASVR